MATENNATDTTTTDAVAATEATDVTQTTEAQANAEAVNTDTTTDVETKDTTAENQPTDVEYTFTLPDGFTANEELTADLTSFAKENKLTAEQAQKIADLGVKMQTQQAAEYQKQVDGWAEQVKTDKLIGGENLQANIGLAKTALKAYGDQELTDLLESTGFGNHPAIVRAFYKIGKSVSNDTLVVSNGTAVSDKKDTASIMFPNMNKG